MKLFLTKHQLRKIGKGKTITLRRGGKIILIGPKHHRKALSLRKKIKEMKEELDSIMKTSQRLKGNYEQQK